MKAWKILFVLFIGLCLTPLSYGASKETSAKKRIVVVDSYHSEYLWSQDTHEGSCAAMLKYGYFDNKEQAAEYTRNDYVETSKAIVKKLWMDTKRNKEKEEIAKITTEITAIIDDFKPDLIFLGDDNAAKYIGNQYLDSEVSMVFWGVNNTPVKYGLVDNIEKPGHNVTGIYQTTYYAESLAFLMKIVPNIKTFAVLTDDTTTGRIHAKAINFLVRKGEIPLKLVETVSTKDSELWRNKALELQWKVDAFFIASSSGLSDSNGNPVSNEDTAKWYINHIRIPEAVGFKYRVEHGWLCTADDSGHNQGYGAVVIAHDILATGAKPSTYPPRVPDRGPYVVNRQRAKILGIELTDDMGIEEYIEEASALKDKADKKGGKR